MINVTAETVYNKFVLDEKHRRLLAQERLILEATECLSRIIERQEVTKTELANRLGKSKAFVTQILNGSRNMTLRTFADLLFALDYTVKLAEQPISQARYDFQAIRVQPRISVGEEQDPFTIFRSQLESDSRVSTHWPNKYLLKTPVKSRVEFNIYERRGK